MHHNPDALFLAHCQLLARQAATQGESAVGALVVCEGQVIATAMEATRRQGTITAHAELLALQAAREHLGHPNLSGCTLYSTHEPCVMCAYAIRYHRVQRVVYAQASAYWGGATALGPVLASTQVPAHWAPPPEIVVLPASENDS